MSSGLFYLNETDFTVKETQKGKTLSVGMLEHVWSCALRSNLSSIIGVNISGFRGKVQQECPTANPRRLGLHQI